MSQDKQDEFAGLSEEDRKLAQRIKAGALERPCPPKPELGQMVDEEQDEQEALAGLSDKDRRLHQLIVKERALELPAKPEPGELARLRANSSTGAVELEPGDADKYYDVRALTADEIRRARKKILARHYLEMGKEEATAKIDQAFGLFPSQENILYSRKDDVLGIITFNVATPTVQDCCGKTNSTRVWVCGRLYVFRGQPDGLTGHLLSRALEHQARDVVVSYADTAQGHTGQIYKNHGFTYRDSGSLKTAHWDWQDVRNPKLDHQTVEQQMRAEKAKETYDPANYQRIQRSAKHCWVWFRNPAADEPLCRWSRAKDEDLPKNLNRTSIHPDTFADTAPSCDLPVLRAPTYILQPQDGSSDDDAGSAYEEKYELATAIMRKVSTWKQGTHGGRPQPCVVSEIRGSWWKTNRERWTGEQVCSMARDLCAYGFLTDVKGAPEFTVIVGDKEFPYPGLVRFSEVADEVKRRRKKINDRYANDSTAKKMVEKIREIQKAQAEAYDDKDAAGVAQLQEEIEEQQDVLREFVRLAYPTGVPRHLHSVSAAQVERPPAPRRPPRRPS